MDLLIEKLDGSRYYLSQYKVLITDFEESAPTVTRNSTQLDQRNGNIDFGGWHTNKTINITGYYRADDIDEEETLREKLYALLSDPDGYYITQLKTTPSVAMERPGETSGSYYDKLNDYPSHKRFLVYTEAPEMELVGNVNGTLLYKLTAEFKTMKLPYGETLAVDISIGSPYKDVSVNLLTGTKAVNTGIIKAGSQGISVFPRDPVSIVGGETYTYSISMINMGHTGHSSIGWLDANKNYIFSQAGNNYKWKENGGRFSNTFIAPSNAVYANLTPWYFSQTYTSDTNISWYHEKFEPGAFASPWSPNPSDSEYNSWYYSLDSNVSVPYSGSVPCNQLEQGFAIELKAKEASSSLSFKIDDTELTYSGAVADGDVFVFNGFNYTKNGLSIVSKTNKAYFILQPDKPNRITCNVPGTVRILGLQNLYA